MSQVINTNALSLVAQNNLNKSQSALGTAIERLSSGLRINSAKDDAAGQAISNRFTANINGLSQASRNANDGISIAQTTEGALNEINDNLQNIRRLSVQAANGTNSDSDRQSIQDEIDARLAEINRISEQTEFNGVKVLSKDQKLTIQVGANDNQTIDIDLNKMDAESLGMEGFVVGKDVDASTLKDTGGKAMVNAGYNYDASKVTDSNTTPATFADIVKDEDGTLYAKTSNGDFAALVDNKDGTFSANSGTTVSPKGNTTSVNGNEAKVEVGVTGLGANDKLLSDSKGNYYIQDSNGDLKRAEIKPDAAAPTTADATASATGKTLITETTADPLATIDKAIAGVSKLLSGLGAVQNRFGSVISNLGSTVNNLSQSRSRILDADFASEVSEMSRANILQSAGTTVLAQANQVPQNVLSLLR
ncbi:MAG: FliC/FljB family flagellin [Enterobacteriaceae bacterium]|jgi:flagellin|nr:FliC/FljB family flagellin [Enterobacteriaceae bacterium]